MKNINKISYLKINNFLSNYNIYPKSNFNDDDFFESVKSFSTASNNDLTFINNNSSKDKIQKIKAKGCLINIGNVDFLPINTIPIIVEDPYKAFAILTNLFYEKEISNSLISKNSFISKKTEINKNAQIDSFVNIKKNCTIHSNVIIGANSSIGPNVTIYDNTIINPNVTLSNCIIGSNCIIKSGAVIGGTGFGFEPVSKIRIQHFGNVIIKNNCNIGSNTTIDRAVFDSTIISENSFIDNLVQIAHNVIIGNDAIIAAQTGIAGSTIIGNNVMIGGQVGIAGHLQIGNNVTIAAKSGVTKNINNNSTVAGFPAINIKKWKIMNIKLNKL
mgnify:CR=1 FL=1